jgi:hypothetical protein
VCIACKSRFSTWESVGKPSRDPDTIGRIEAILTGLGRQTDMALDLLAQLKTDEDET